MTMYALLSMPCVMIKYVLVILLSSLIDARVVQPTHVVVFCFTYMLHLLSISCYYYYIHLIVAICSYLFFDGFIVLLAKS
jgi:hypothetical protein